MKTPLEYADGIAKAAHALTVGEIRESIHLAILACCNEELERRRAAEAELQNIRAGAPVLVCTPSTRLRVWNAEAKRWAEFDGNFVDVGVNGGSR